MRPKKVNRLRMLRYLWLRHKFRNYTMISGNSYVGNLALVDWWRGQRPLSGGSIVECGTWRGGMPFSLIDMCDEAAQIH